MSSTLDDNWINHVSFRKDGLYEKLANGEEGWTITEDEIEKDVPLNEIDLFAYSTLLKTIQQKKKVAIALPRVKTGVSLSIIAYLVVNRLLTKNKRYIKDFIPLPLENDQPVVIATKNRKLRDFFLKSSLKFNGINFPFTKFPINRINRIGIVTPLSNATGQIEQEPIIFYHFDNIESFPEILQNGYCVGEITETDSIDITFKLCKFINTINSKSSLIFVNEFANGSLALLKEHGFTILALRNSEISKTNLTTNIYNLPSLGSSLALYPKKINLKINLLNNEIINQSDRYTV